MKNIFALFLLSTIILSQQILNCYADTEINDQANPLIEQKMPGVVNPEPVKIAYARLDKTPPFINIAYQQPLSYLHSATLDMSFSYGDSQSGLGSITAMLDGKTAVNGQSVYLLPLSLGHHEMVVSAIDSAGNAATSHVDFKVIANLDSLIATVKYFALQGDIDDGTILIRLLNKLNGAKSGLARGNNKLANNQLDEFIQQVKAQGGKHINLESAQLLISDSNFVLGTL